MARDGLFRIAVLVLIGVIALSLALIASESAGAAPGSEYKFVQLVDSGAMPKITEALNREAEQGWKLEEMSVTSGDPGTIYLVFTK